MTRSSEMAPPFYRAWESLLEQELAKTQLAIEYAHRFGSAYIGGVYWVGAELGLIAMITQIGSAAGIDVDPKAEEVEQVTQLWRELNSRNLPCLVILDNFP